MTNATNVKNVTNGTFLNNVTDSINVTQVYHSINMTNATNCQNARSNYNCTSYQCNIPRIDDQSVLDLIEKRIYFHSMNIIDKLYDSFKVGDIESFRNNKNRFD